MKSERGMSPEERYALVREKLKGLVDEMDDIDITTPWQAVEPEWWLEMVGIRYDIEKVLGVNMVEKYDEK